MPDTLMFSIITVCYNSEKTIERTIRSVLNQQFTDYEYIIVDGGSTDNTLDIIKKYEVLFNGKLKWKSEPDKGIYDAFNKGIRRSNGIYIWIVNSDDFIESDALERIYCVIQEEVRNPDTIISAKLNYIDENTHKVLYTGYKDASTAKQCYKLDKMGITHPATIVSKSVYDKYGLFDDRYKLLGDMEWFHRIYSTDVSIIFKDEVVSNMSNAGISGQYSWKRFKISYADRKLYFRTYYKNILLREGRKFFWVMDFVRVALKKDWHEDGNSHNPS